MNKTKELKDIISITELNPSKTYLVSVKGKVGDGIMNIYHDLQKLGIKVLIVPEDWIESVMEISEEEAGRIARKIEER